MKIVNIAENDYANYSHNNAKSLRSIGVNCVDFTLQSHKFKYKTESKKATINEMIKHISTADICQVMHSHTKLFEIAKEHCKGRVVVYHTGSRYRVNPGYYNDFFKGHKTFTDQTEFMDLGDHEYIISPVEFETPKFYRSGKIKIGHFPSNTETKGSAQIIEMLKPFNNKLSFLYSASNVDHANQIKRMSDCDVYVEMFKPELIGKPYGCFGVTGLEATAMGKIVITNNLHKEVYQNTYGECPFLIANDKDEFVSKIEFILKMSPVEIKDFQQKSIQLMQKNHSFEATGNRTIDALYPMVSVIIPMNKDRGFLERAKQSVINQNYTKIELIISKSKRNVSFNINRGAEKASGKYVKYLSEDDTLTENSIKDSVDAMEKFGYDFLHGNAYNHHPTITDKFVPGIKNPTIKQLRDVDWIMHGGTNFYRKSIFDSGFRFDETITCAEERDFHLKLLVNGFKLGYVNSFLYNYFYHPEQKSLGKGVDQNKRRVQKRMIKKRYEKY